MIFVIVAVWSRSLLGIFYGDVQKLTRLGVALMYCIVIAEIVQPFLNPPAEG